MSDRLYWWLVHLSYWAEDHQATVLVMIALALLLYAAIVALNLLRRIAAAVEAGQK